MPKSRKRTFKTKLGVLKRIYRRDLIWNQNRKTILKINKVFERVNYIYFNIINLKKFCKYVANLKLICHLTDM